MLSLGPSGFEHAPITKALMVTVGALSILGSTLGRSSLLELPSSGTVLLKDMQLWRLLTGQLFFSRTGELMFGMILIYCFRLFERHWGSAKFGGFVFLVMICATLQHVALLTLLPGLVVSSGPYSLIFALFVMFYCDIPATSRFHILGVPASDKWFMYLLGSQLLFSDGISSAAAGLCGIVSGILYKSDTLQLSRTRLPALVNNACSRFIRPLIQSSRQNRRGLTPVRGISTGAPTSQNGPVPRPMRQGFADQLIPDVHGQFALPGMQQAAVRQPARQPASPQSIEMLTSMGFAREVVVQALQQANNDVELATHFLLEQH